MFETSSGEKHEHEQQQQTVNKGEDEKERVRGGADGAEEATHDQAQQNLSSDQQQQQQQKETPQVASNQQHQPQQQLPVSSFAQKVWAASPAMITSSMIGPRPLQQQVDFREARDSKVIGLKNYGMSQSTYMKRQKKPGTTTSAGSVHSTTNNNEKSRRGGANNNMDTGGGGGASVVSFLMPKKSVEELEDDARQGELTNRDKVLLVAIPDREGNGSIVPFGAEDHQIVFPIRRQLRPGATWSDFAENEMLDSIEIRASFTKGDRTRAFKNRVDH